MGPVGIFRNRLVIWSYLVLLRSVMYVDVYMNYDSVKIACRETSRFQIYRSEKATNGQNWDILWYILKCRDQTYMVFWIENGGNSGLDMLKTICVQSFSFQSYSLAKGPEKQQKTTKWGEKSVFFFTFFVYICILSQATYVFWQSKLIQLHPETLGAFLGKIGHIWEISPRPSFSKQNVDLVIFCVSTISIDLDSYC